MKRILVASTLLISALTAGVATANPVVVGDPAKGREVLSIKGDKGEQIRITTKGISVNPGPNGSKQQAEEIENALSDYSFVSTSSAEDILVPLFLFFFLAAVILGRRYFDSRNEEKRLQTLRAMLEKGQTIPDAVITQVFSKEKEVESSQSYKRTRNAYGFTIAGVLLFAYGAAMGRLTSDNILVPGFIFLCLGIGGMAGLYLTKPVEEKKST